MLHSTSSSEDGNSGGCVSSWITVTMVFSSYSFTAIILTAICLTVAEAATPTVGCSKGFWKSFSQAQPRVQPSVLSKILYVTNSLCCYLILFPAVTPSRHCKGVCDMLTLGRFFFLAHIHVLFPHINSQASPPFPVLLLDD